MVRRATLRAAALAAAVLLAASCGGDDGEVGADDAAATTTTGARQRPPGYVALGDSFSAGEGAGAYDDASGRCRRTERSWPYVLDELGAGSDDVQLLDHRACGGARIVHLLEPWSDRDQPAQIPSSPDDRVGLVTFTIGGNDAGFSDIVAQCVLSSCADVPGSAEFQERLDAITERLTDEVHPALRAAFPEALLVHVGYPSLTPAPGEPLQRPCGWLSGDERAAIPEIIRSLDDAFRAATAATDDDGLRFVSVSGAFDGHELCTDEPWVNEVVSLDSGRAHPTAAGYEAIARAVTEALTSVD